MMKLLSFKTLILLLIIANNSIAQLNRFERVEWNVISSKGLSNKFEVEMILYAKNGDRLKVMPNTKLTKWSAFKFHLKTGNKFENGIGTYLIQKEFHGEDTITIPVTCSNPALNSEIKVPVRYCNSIFLDKSNLVVNQNDSINIWMKMNTGEQFAANQKWLDFGILKNESDRKFEINYQNFTVRLKEGTSPFDTGLIQFTHKNTKETILDQTLSIDFPDVCRLYYSGRHGRHGRSGQNGSIPSESGKNGENGGDGENGRDVTVFIRPCYFGEKQVMEILADGNGVKTKTYVSMEVRNIVVYARGGNGGNGGNGGKGADAEKTDKSYDRLNGGNGGYGGNGGVAGHGGDVLIIVDKNCNLSEEIFIVENERGEMGYPGNAGKGGRNDTGDAGIIEYLLNKNDNGESGESGYSGTNANDGVFLGITYEDNEQIEERLKKLGWR